MNIFIGGVLEDCKSLTELIVSLQSEVRTVDQLFESEQYEALQNKIDEINQILAEKKEFFYWRSLKVTLRDNLNIFDGERDQLIEGFWPVQVSPSGLFLAYGAGGSFTVINLESGEIEKDKISLVSIEQKKLKPSNFYLNDSGTIYLRANTDDQPNEFKIYSFANDGRQLIPGSTECPIRFPISRLVAEYELGKLSSSGFAFLRGPDFDSTGYNGLPFADIKTALEENYAYTLNKAGELHYWDLKREIYLQQLASDVKEFLILPGETNLIILGEDQLFYFYFVEPTHDSPGKFERKVLAAGPKENFYTKIAKSTDNKYLFAINTDGWLDIYNLESMELSRKIDLSKKLKCREIKSLDYGVNDQLIISATKITENNIGGNYFMFPWQKIRSDEVIIFQPKWGEND